MTPDRLAQIINDIAEEMNYGNHTRKEYRDVINTLQDENTHLRMALQSLRADAALALLQANSHSNKEDAR